MNDKPKLEIIEFPEDKRTPEQIREGLENLMSGPFGISLDWNPKTDEVKIIYLNKD